MFKIKLKISASTALLRFFAHAPVSWEINENAGAPILYITINFSRVEVHIHL